MSQITHNTTSIFDWVDGLFRDIFFQPDDTVALKAISRGISPDHEFVARINDKKFTGAQFLEVVKAARAKDFYNLQSNEEVLVWDAPDGSGAGSVTQLARFTSVDKETGKEAKTTTVTLATVGVLNGNRVLLEFAEITKDE